MCSSQFHIGHDNVLGMQSRLHVTNGVWQKSDLKNVHLTLAKWKYLDLPNSVAVGEEPPQLIIHHPLDLIESRHLQNTPATRSSSCDANNAANICRSATSRRLRSPFVTASSSVQ